MFAQAFAEIAGAEPEGLRHSRSVDRVGTPPATGPCRFPTERNSVVGAAEDSIDALVGLLVDFLEDHAAVFPNAGEYLAMAGLTSDIAEALLAALTLRAHMSIDDNPLVRTQSRTQAGESTQLRARASFHTDNPTLLNCLRLAFSVVGLSGITVPSGPAKGVEADFTDSGGFNELDGFVQYEGDITRVRAKDEGERAGEFPPIGVSGVSSDKMCRTAKPYSRTAVARR